MFSCAFREKVAVVTLCFKVVQALPAIEKSRRSQTCVEFGCLCAVLCERCGYTVSVHRAMWVPSTLNTTFSCNTPFPCHISSILVLLTLYNFPRVVILSAVDCDWQNEILLDIFEIFYRPPTRYVQTFQQLINLQFQMRPGTTCNLSFYKVQHVYCLLKRGLRRTSTLCASNLVHPEVYCLYKVCL